jgi:hypothetical protein
MSLSKPVLVEDRLSTLLDLATFLLALDHCDRETVIRAFHP